MISRDAARKAWLHGLRNPQEKPWKQLPSPSKREFESWVVESYKTLHSEIFENRKLKPQYLFANEMYAYLILKNWKSRIGFGEGKVEDLRQVLDYETYFLIWVFMEYREEHRDNDWIAASFDNLCIHLNDSEVSDKLFKLLNEAWEKALEFYMEGVTDEGARKEFFDLNRRNNTASYKTWWIRKVSRESEEFNRWFIESGLGREAYRLLEYEDRVEPAQFPQEQDDEDKEEDWTDSLLCYDGKGVFHNRKGSYKHVSKRDDSFNYIPPTIRGGKSY